MTDVDRKITRFVLKLLAAMAAVGSITLVILWGLAVLIPLSPEGLGNDLRNAAGMVIALLLGLRISRLSERRWRGR